MNVDFYTFSKRINSTAQPTGGASYSCVLKSVSSVTAPRISLVWGGTGNPSAYNYAYISDYGRYYWVNNWTFSDRQWSADLSVDVLATYKTEIGSATKYVLRAASSYNAHVLDNMYPAKSTAHYGAVDVQAFANPAWANYGAGGGRIVVTVIGKDNQQVTGNAVMFSLTGTEFQDVLAQALDAMYNGAENLATAAYSETDTSKALAQLIRIPSRFFSDLTQYIKGVMWYPFDFTGTAGEAIYLGVYHVGAGKLITTPVQVDNVDIDVSSIPGTGRDDWEEIAPFATYTLEAWPWGSIDIDSIDVLNSSAIRCIIKTDALSGLSRLTVFAVKGTETPRLIAARTAQIGVSIPFGGTSPNYAGAITGMMSVAATAAAYSSGNVGGAALAGSIGNAVMASAPSGYASGTSGGGAGLQGGQVVLYKRLLDHTDLDPTEIGKPLCEMKTLSTLSGYIQCRDGDISAPGTASELAQLESYLTGGFFYE